MYGQLGQRVTNLRPPARSSAEGMLQQLLSWALIVSVQSSMEQRIKGNELSNRCGFICHSWKNKKCCMSKIKQVDCGMTTLEWCLDLYSAANFRLDPLLYLHCSLGRWPVKTLFVRFSFLGCFLLKSCTKCCSFEDGTDHLWHSKGDVGNWAWQCYLWNFCQAWRFGT